MAFLKGGYFEDGIKAIVYAIPLLYIIIKRRDLKLKYFWLFVLGLSLLFFGHILDFFDEFESLKDVFIIGKACIFHDFIEDAIGLTLGFLIIILAAYLEMRAKEGR